MNFESKNLEPFIKDESGKYSLLYPVTADDIVQTAMAILGERFLHTISLTDINLVKDFFIARLSEFDGRVLDIAFLDDHYSVLGYRRLYAAYLRKPAEYKRWVTQWALELKATQVVFARKYLPKDIEETTGDHIICAQLQALLQQLNIGIFEYLSISDKGVTSFSYEGYLSNEKPDLYDEYSLRQGGFDVPLGIL